MSPSKIWTINVEEYLKEEFARLLEYNRNNKVVDQKGFTCRTVVFPEKEHGK